MIQYLLSGFINDPNTQMRRTNIQSNMQQFIQYKLNNRIQCQQEGRALVLKRKYQRILDEIFKIIQAKKSQLQRYQYEMKKMRKRSHDHLEKINTEIKQIENEKDQYENQINRLEDQEKKTHKRVQQQRKMNDFQERNLEQKIKTSLHFSNNYMIEKVEVIKKLIGTSNEIQQQIDKIEPTVNNVKQKHNYKERLKQNIEQAQQKLSKILQQKKVNSQILQIMNKKALEVLNLRKQEENDKCYGMREKISIFIQELNKILQSKQNTEKNLKLIEEKKGWLELKTKQLQDLSIENVSKDNKYIEIGKSILGEEPNKQNYKMYVNKGLLEKYEKKISILRNQIESAKIKQKQFLEIQATQIEKQSAKQKQLQTLLQTVERIETNLKNA